MIYNGLNKEFLELEERRGNPELRFDESISFPLLFVWMKGNKSSFLYEGEKHGVPNNTILCLTAFHQIEFENIEQVRIIKFNREFYCVHAHDTEVSCRGLLFYGAQNLPYFEIPVEELEKFETLWSMFQLELTSKEALQLELLQLMLKRFILLCTRIYKVKMNYSQLQAKEIDIVRDFHFLVEQHFKTKHTVKEYAELLNKSAKTLGNIFSMVSEKSPLQIIHERKLLEAKRMLRYANKSVKEVAYELGFEDIQTFGRFFKKSENKSPSDYKNEI